MCTESVQVLLLISIQIQTNKDLGVRFLELKGK